ncbi:DALR anticodon-binding domain-containing protein [Streptomyces thermospinosisporus]|uniref:arginine--tRNA ligase n=1 Tax=Streptomyces thermospinosisporus TaxID=161482 RepID=A0ABN1YLE6_9ACTN
MTPVELSRTVLRAVRCAVDEGELRVAVPERAQVGPPGPGGCGDYATSIALQLAKPAGQPPLRVAEVLRSHLLRTGAVADVVVTGPGFLNISLPDTAPATLVEEILRAGVRYGHSDALAGQVFRLRAPDEVRALTYVDVLARILRSQGAAVRVQCEGESGNGSSDLRPESPESPESPEWVDVLGLRLESTEEGNESATAAAAHTHTHTLPIRPVPAPGDPSPLGRDAGRWALLYPAPHDRPRLTAEHLSQREGNPLFRVRYAHARTRALLRNAADLGFRPEPGPVTEPAAPELLAVLGDHPRILRAAADRRAPDRLARHLVTVADALRPLLPTVLPLGAEKPSAAHRARLALAEAAGTVLAGGLSLLGIDAPDHL